MICSMTGFGRAEKTGGGWTCGVELRSVNNRFLDARFKMPSGFAVLEEKLKGQVKARLERGKVDGTVQLTPARGNEGSLRLNQALAADLALVARQLREDHGLEVRVGLSDLFSVRDLLQTAEPQQESGAVEALISATVEQALDGLQAMRRAEGQALARDLQERLATLSGLMERIRPLTPLVVERYAQRLKDNLARHLKEGEYNEDRVAMEIALFAEKSDVAEELTRIDAHLDHFAAQLKKGEAVGRQLDFLLQELNREINTLSNKSSEADISQLAVEVKGELEKLREQVQNIE